MSVIDQRIPFQKYHGTGNDFLVVDATHPVPDRAAFAAAYCDRDRGVTVPHSGRVGGDGVLFLALTEETRPPRVVMTLVQPDGSVAEMCGNGARCAAAWAAAETGASEFMLDTPAGTRRATVGDGEATIEMGRPSFAPHRVPLADDEELVETAVEGLAVTAVNTGVPHAVAFVHDVPDEYFESGVSRTSSDAIDAVDLEAVAPPVRHADAFPEGTNVTLAARDGAGFRQRTYERGVEGETRACGTGAVAVVAAAKRLGRLPHGGEGGGGDEGESDVEGEEITDEAVAAGDEIRVSPPGGDLHVAVPDDAPATLRGPVEHDFDGEVRASPE